MATCKGLLCAGLSTVALLSACRTPAGARLSEATDTSTSTATTTPPDCEQVAVSIHLSSTTIRDFCSGADPASKTTCMLAASEPLTRPDGARVTPSPALSSIYIAELCARDAADQVAACIRAARLAGLGSIDTNSLCASGSPDTAACLTASSEPLAADPSGGTPASGPLGSFDMTTLCKGAGPSVASCISAARRSGMSSATTYTTCKKGGASGSSAECLAAASASLPKQPGAAVTPSAPLSSMTASSLCSGSAASGVTTCITTARMAGFNDANTYTLCKSGSAGTAPCIMAATRDMSAEANDGFTPTAPLGTFSVLGVCSSGKEGSGPCVDAGRLTGLSATNIAHICSQGTDATGSCIKAARPSSAQALSDSYTLTLCKRASSSTESCITDARAAGKSAGAILNACRPSGE